MADTINTSYLGALQGATALASMYAIGEQSKIRQLTYEHNARMAEFNAWFINREVRKNEKEIREQGRKILGQARAAGASTGFALSSISQTQVEGATIRSIEQDVAALNLAGEVEKFKARSEGASYQLAAGAAATEGKLQQVQTLLSASDKISKYF